MSFIFANLPDPICNICQVKPCEHIRNDAAAVMLEHNKMKFSMRKIDEIVDDSKNLISSMLTKIGELDFDLDDIVSTLVTTNQLFDKIKELTS